MALDLRPPPALTIFFTVCTTHLYLNSAVFFKVFTVKSFFLSIFLTKFGGFWVGVASVENVKPFEAKGLREPGLCKHQMLEFASSVKMQQLVNQGQTTVDSGI